MNNNNIKLMSYNSFDYYQQLRQYQLHMQKLSNPETKVPNHSASKPHNPHFQRARKLQRSKRIEQIEVENSHIMKKLVNINRRKSKISQSTPNLVLPKIKKEFSIPTYEQQNNLIARKIIQSKPRVSSITDTDRYRSLQAKRRNLSKYYNQDGVVVNRKKYIAELMLLKKMRMSEVIRNKS